MIIYRINMNKYVPEQTLIEKCSYNKKTKETRVLKSRSFPGAYFYQTGKFDFKRTLNKNFFESLAGKMPKLQKRPYYVQLSMSPFYKKIDGYCFEFCGRWYGIPKNRGKHIALTDLETGCLFKMYKTFKDLALNLKNVDEWILEYGNIDEQSKKFKKILEAA